VKFQLELGPRQNGRLHPISILKEALSPYRSSFEFTLSRTEAR
jgi:hypothetical protein